MKVLIRTRNKNVVLHETLDFLLKHKLEVIICEHPLGKSFADFHNDFFKTFVDKYDNVILLYFVFHRLHRA